MIIIKFLRSGCLLELYLNLASNYSSEVFNYFETPKYYRV
jgi:hypothetical protein